MELPQGAPHKRKLVRPFSVTLPLEQGHRDRLLYLWRQDEVGRPWGASQPLRHLGCVRLDRAATLRCRSDDGREPASVSGDADGPFGASPTSGGSQSAPYSLYVHVISRGGKSHDLELHGTSASPSSLMGTKARATKLCSLPTHVTVCLSLYSIVLSIF